MTLILEEDALQEWLVGYLSADSALMGMLNGSIAPEAHQGTTASPFVRVDRLEATDLMVIGLHRVWTDALYHIRGVYHWNGSGTPDRADVNAIGARLDTLLHDSEVTATVTGATFSIHGFREEPTPSPAVVEPNGELWLQSGGLYRLRVSAT